MNETRWEYCQLLLGTDRSRDKNRYHLSIRYFGAGSVIISRLKGEPARDWEIDPWEQAIAELGAGGWEMVSTHHPNVAGDMGGGGEIGHHQAVAYFKRPIVEGRAITEPELKLEEAEARLTPWRTSPAPAQTGAGTRQSRTSARPRSR